MPRRRASELEAELSAVRDRAELAGAAEQRVAALEAQLVERDAQSTAAAEELARRAMPCTSSSRRRSSCAARTTR